MISQRAPVITSGAGFVCRVHLVRHGAHCLPDGVLAGRGDVGLSMDGQAQAAKLSRQLADSGARAVLTSPVQRTRETAQPIAAAMGLMAEVVEGLNEVDFGAWTGKHVDELAHCPAWVAWNRARGLSRTPAGESMVAVQARALEALTRAATGGGTIIVVSHADVIKAVLAHALGSPLDLLHRLELAPAGRSILTLGEDWVRVEAVNLPL